MTTVLIVIHLMVVLAMIGLVLLQRSEGGALGIGGGSGGFMTGRGAGNVLTRSTAILAAAFFLTSVGLSVLARLESQPSDILDRIPSAEAPAGGATAPAPLPAGTPTSAEDLLRSLGGASGPQTPPAAETPAAQAPAAAAPEPSVPPAAAPAPAQPEPAPPAAPAPPLPAPPPAAPAP